MQDITAQAQAQAALAHREEQYRLLADNATDVVLRTDTGGFVVYASPSCAELSGYHPEELNGHHCGEFMHPDDATIVHEAHVSIITDQKSATTVEYRLRHKDGDVALAGVAHEGVAQAGRRRPMGSYQQFAISADARSWKPS